MNDDNRSNYCVEALTQVLYSYPDETIDAITEYFDKELDYIFETYKRPARYTLLAEEITAILQTQAASSAMVDLLISIFRRHGIVAGRVSSVTETNWGESCHGYIHLGPIFVAMGSGQEREEDAEVLDAAESLCSIRLTNHTSVPVTMAYC